MAEKDSFDQQSHDTDSEQGIAPGEPLLPPWTSRDTSTVRTGSGQSRKILSAIRDCRLSLLSFCLLQLLMVALYTAAFFSFQRQRPSLVYSPASEALHYKKVRYNASLVIESPYNGPPSKEVDSAWSDLISNMNIAVPKSDLDRIGSHSILIPDTDNMHFGGLGVFHELHCIKRLRQYTWKEHYFPDSSEEDERLNRLHTDHCLEILRQAAMCRSDVTLFTLQWSEGSRFPRADFSQEHECVDFDAVNGWAADRRVEAGTPGILTHPKFGLRRWDNRTCAFLRSVWKSAVTCGLCTSPSSPSSDPTETSIFWQSKIPIYHVPRIPKREVAFIFSMVPSSPIFGTAISALIAMVALLILAAMPAAAATQNDTTLEKRGIGWLYDYCDDDWSIMPPYYFTGKCNVTHPQAARDWLSIDLTGCYTVTDDGYLSVDNNRV
ncbi:hypothetical protein PG996_004747 [Apiospora saccharicola]|uniref:Uncharacterized protein n=1 Tax=Apiospora saccharicola TaxID=335842 RepID=A0ABR1W692_9PEZI